MLGELAAFLLLPAAAGESPAGNAGFDPPATVVSAWAEAARAFDVVDQCDETSRQLGFETRHKEITNRYYAALRRAKGIWGNTLSDGAEHATLTVEPAVCRPANILQAMKEAELALDNEDGAFANVTVRMASGAWVGPLMLCQETVLSAEPGFEAIAGQPMVLVTLQPGFAGALGSITARSIESPLAIRLDGEVISEPMVYEKIDGGRFQVTGPELTVLERLSDAVGRPC
jgi:hypothetical protein